MRPSAICDRGKLLRSRTPRAPASHRVRRLARLRSTHLSAHKHGAAAAAACTLMEGLRASAHLTVCARQQDRTYTRTRPFSTPAASTPARHIKLSTLQII
eukprot:1975128-Pleurochrysis_carterae.AAC.3